MAGAEDLMTFQYCFQWVVLPLWLPLLTASEVHVLNKFSNRKKTEPAKNHKICISFKKTFEKDVLEREKTDEVFLIFTKADLSDT